MAIFSVKICPHLDFFNLQRLNWIDCRKNFIDQSTIIWKIYKQRLLDTLFIFIYKPLLIYKMYSSKFSLVRCLNNSCGDTINTHTHSCIHTHTTTHTFTHTVYTSPYELANKTLFKAYRLHINLFWRQVLEQNIFFSIFFLKLINCYYSGS